MNEEYTYDIGKYTIGVDKNGEDGIGLTVAIINDNGEIHLLGNCYGDNARCIDLLIKENQQLKGSLQTHEILLKANVEENQQLKEQLQQKEDNINKARDKIQEIAYGGNEDYYMEKIKSVLKILDNKG